jgi:hypothetical protein
MGRPASPHSLSTGTPEANLAVYPWLLGPPVRHLAPEWRSVSVQEAKACSSLINNGICRVVQCQRLSQ